MEAQRIIPSTSICFSVKTIKEATEQPEIQDITIKVFQLNHITRMLKYCRQTSDHSLFKCDVSER